MPLFDVHVFLNIIGGYIFMHMLAVHILCILMTLDNRPYFIYFDSKLLAYGNCRGIAFLINDHSVSADL